MQTRTTEPVDTSTQCCPNQACPARGQRGAGTITLHDKQRRRYRCKICKQTLSEWCGTMFEGLHKPRELIIIVVMLLAYGCPVQENVQSFHLDERTVADRRDRAGQHCQQVHEALVEQGKLDLVHVQAHEIRVKGRKMVAWIGLALMVSMRLWSAGAVRLNRDKRLADGLLQQVHRAAKRLCPFLILTDGWVAGRVTVSGEELKEIEENELK